MPLLEYTGNAVITTLTDPLTTGSLSMNLGNASGWPTGTTANWTATIDQGGPNEEKVLCGVRSGNSVTIIQRGYDGTAPKTHGLETVKHTISAVAMAEASQHIHDVGRDDHAQYLTIGRHDTPLRHGTDVIADLAITTAKIANLGVTTGKLADLGVTTAKIADLAVTVGKLAASIYGPTLSDAASNVDGVLGTLARSDHQHDAVFSDLRVKEGTGITLTTSNVDQIGDLVVPAGQWFVLGFLRTNASINVSRLTHVARIQNTTDNITLVENDRGVDNETSNNSGTIPLWGVLNQAGPKTFQVQARTTVVNGTQFGGIGVLAAMRFAHVA